MFNNKKIFYIILILLFFLILIYFQYTRSLDQVEPEVSIISIKDDGSKEIETPIIDENIIDENIQITQNKVVDKYKLEASSGTFDVVRIDRDVVSVIAGRSDPNVKIKIYNEENLIGEGNSDQNGQWITVIDEKIPNKILNLKISTSNLSGDNEIFSDQIVTVMPSKLDELATDDLKDENNIVLLTQEDNASD